MNKQQQKQLITDIMNDDAKDGLYKKHTAVDWLYHKLQSECLIDMADDIFEQAKQMERNQIIDAVGVGSQFDRGYLYGYHDKAEQYYTQTHGQ